MRDLNRSILFLMLLTLTVLMLATNQASAYIGPGADLSLAPYFFALLAMFGAAVLSILTWPIYAAIRFFRGPKPAPITKTTPAAETSLATEPAPVEQPQAPI